MVLKSTILSILPLLLVLSHAKELLQNNNEETEGEQNIVDADNQLEDNSDQVDNLEVESLDDDGMNEEEENLSEQLTALAVEEDSAGTSLHSIDLDIGNFDSQVLDHETKLVRTDKPWMVKFFAPWCPHC